MLQDFMQWFKGDKYKPSMASTISQDPIGIEETLRKAELDRKHVEELLKKKRTGNVLADSWGGRVNEP